MRPTYAPTPRERRVDLSSLLTGVAFGAVITVLATLAVVPENGNGSNGEAEIIAVGDGAGQGIDPQDIEGGEVETTSGGGSGVAGGPDTGGAATDGNIDLGVGGGVTGPGSDSSKGADGGHSNCSGTKSEDAPGVTDTEIKLGATVVTDGFAARFLGEVPQAIRAVEKKVNLGGGICGRQLKVITKNDNWEADTGKRNIENLIEQEGVFAFAVSPSSEGLNAASQAGVFERHGVPVVGADGLNNTQFLDPMIWPVAAATTTTVHVIMKNAHERCQKRDGCMDGGFQPSIVYGNNYRFGVEGAFAYNAAYNELTGNNIPGHDKGGCSEGSRYCGVASNEGSYSTQVSRINGACFNGDADDCDFLLILLEPDTALNFLGTSGAPTAAKLMGETAENSNPGVGMAGAQPLFTAGFARNCGEPCKDMWVWTGYNPPIEQYAPSRNAATRRYVDDLKAQSGSIDTNNQFTEGGYIGMLLLAEALERVGNNLTRERLVETLNSMPALETGLSVPLKWTKDKRYANHSAQAFSIPVANGWTGNWEFRQKYVEDEWLGQHNRI